jgi:hypothetical protein
MFSSSNKKVGVEEQIAKSGSDELSTTPTGRSVNVVSSKKIAKDMTWTNVNYNVGSKKILTECWGQV